MLVETRRRALYAAAKLVISVSALGCGATVVDQEVDATDTEVDAKVPSPEVETETETAIESPTAMPGTPRPRCGISSVPDVVSEETFSCCVRTVEKIFAHNPSTHQPAPVCCGAIVEAVDDALSHSSPGAGEMYTRAIQKGALFTCCDRMEWPAGPACTPWGPPVPPAMPIGVA